MSATAQPTTENPVGLEGIEFAEFAGPDPAMFERLFLEFGFSKVMHHPVHDIDLFRQNDIVFLVNRQPGSFASQFASMHGPSLCSMGWKVGSG